MLRELGASQVRASSSGDATAELMRLAADPLLLHGFLRPRAAPELPPPVGPRPPFFCLAPGTAAPEARIGSAHYGAVDPHSSPSVLPETFAPSADDRVAALTLAPALPLCGQPQAGRAGWLVASAGAAALLLLCLALW